MAICKLGHGEPLASGGCFCFRGKDPVCGSRCGWFPGIRGPEVFAMLAKLFTYSLFGIEARAVEVEVDISSGSLPRTILVGLAEAAVRESTHLL